MSFMSRIKTLFKAKANKAIDAAEKADPIGIAKSEYRQAQEELGKYERAIKEFTAQKLLLKQKAESARKASQEWLAKAKIAKDNGNMELAEKACERSVAFGEEADKLDQQVKTVETQYIQKKEQFDRKTTEIKALGEKIKNAEVSFNVAKASNELDKSMTANGGSNSIDKINDMLTVVDNQVALSEASDIINDTPDMKIDREFDKLTSGKKAKDLLNTL